MDNRNAIITNADRELLAAAYDEMLRAAEYPHRFEGPFPYYATEARDPDSRAFTNCALRAIARARLARSADDVLVNDFVDRINRVSLSSVWLMEADAVHQAWIAMLPEPARTRVLDAIRARFDAKSGIDNRIYSIGKILCAES